MKKILVSVLCCALLMGGLTACSQKPAEAPVAQTADNEESVASSTAETTESKATESAESTLSETIESEASSETSIENTTQEEVFYVVELTSYNNEKVKVIKAYRELTGLGLKEAKDTVDLAPCVILETTDEEMANQYKTALEEAGATVTINDGTTSTTETAAENTVASTSEAPDTGATFTVDSIFYITDAGTVLTGTVEQGCIKMGDSVVIILEDGTEIPATVNRIEVFGSLLDKAEAGQNIGLGFEEDIAKETVLTAVSVDVVTE